MAAERDRAWSIVGIDAVATLRTVAARSDAVASELATKPSEKELLETLMARGYIRRTVEDAGTAFGVPVIRFALTDDGERLLGLLEPLVDELGLGREVEAVLVRRRNTYLTRSAGKSRRLLYADRRELIASTERAVPDPGERQGEVTAEYLAAGPTDPHGLMPYDIIEDPLTHEEISTVDYRRRYGAFPYPDVRVVARCDGSGEPSEDAAGDAGSEDH